MFIIIALNDGDVFEENNILSGLDIGDRTSAFVSTKTNREEALTEFNQQLVDQGIEEDSSLDENMEYFEDYGQIHIFEISNQTELNMENWMNEIKVQIGLQLIANTDEEEKALYLKLKERYEGRNL